MAANVAAQFSTSSAYAVGDLALYDGNLFRFTSSHSAGSWNPAHVSAVDGGTDVQRELTRILSGMDNADKAADYADTVVFAPEQISGTRFRYFLTDAADPRE